MKWLAVGLYFEQRMRMGKEWIIQANSELRCEIKAKESLTVHLLEGNAEIFGIEMATDHKYFFEGEENIAIFSWYGCKLQTEGTCQDSSMYSSNETPMTALVNIHAQLEARRDIAALNDDRGPRVLVVGPTESGKSTTARILAMYAARLDRTPVLADIDVAQSLVCGVPGCLGAISVDKSCLSMEVSGEREGGSAVVGCCPSDIFVYPGEFRCGHSSSALFWTH